MHIEIFEDSKSGSAADQFKAWRLRFPSGYYLNRKARTRYMLHTSPCGHIDPTVDAEATKARKACALTIAELLEWAEEEGLEIVRCGSCQP